VLLGARVDGLIEEAGAVRGVRYSLGGGNHQLRAPLV
jgi:hypothetical protein